MMMESWCELVSSYPEDPEPKNYAKALQTANMLLSSDLAPFEIEWLVQTLLYKPVDVFNTIAAKRGNEDWLKNIGDSFKVISKIVCKYWSIVERYHDDIIKLCVLSFDPQTKKEAINCHINVLKNPGVDMGNGKQHINALESSTTCKAPLALLVGNICKYCPEGVDQEYIRVWRIYLNMLRQKNITDTVVNAILQGIDGLFENFGRELPMMELNDFYKDLSRKCAKLSKCIEPLLSILKSHAGLFKERLAEDQVLRIYLWGINSPSVKDALLAIYTVIFEQSTQNKIKELINAEIQPKMDSDISVVKHTALCIAIYAKIHHGVPIKNMYRPDVLEFQMRHRSISNQEADLVSICLASRESYVKSLLVTVIMHYDNIPMSRRQSILVEGIIEASKDIRKLALSLLIELSRQDGGLQKYADVWRAILDSDSKGTDVLEDVLHHVVFLMRAFVDAAVKKPEQMLSLSSVLSFVLCVSKTDDSTQYKELLRPVIVEVANILCVCPTSLLSCKFVCVEMFKRDSVLKEILSSFDNNKENDTLSVLQLIFSKPTDTKLLIRALSEMDILLKSEDIEYRHVTNIMKHILKLKSRKNVNTSDDRILKRDLAVFVGEHSRYLERENFTDDLYFMEMSNKITLTIPNISNGKNYKIELLRILQISLVWEDLETLHCLLTIISANLRDRLDPGLQTVVWRICRAIIRSGEGCDVTAALRMCSTTACVQQAVQSVIGETDPEVRRRLCDSLQVMLLQDPGSEKSGELLTMVAEQLLDMISSPDQPNYKAGLDITQAFINTLQENDEICIKFLPKIIILTSINTDKEVYKCATEMFIEKMDNFDEDNIKEMIEGVIKSAKLNENKIHLGFVLDFLKKIFEARDFDNNMLVDSILDGFDYNADGDVNMTNVGDARQYANLLQILALSKQTLEFDDDVTSSIITMNDFGIINKMVTIVGTCTDVFVQQNAVTFLNEYAGPLLDDMKEQTINCISTIIENIPPSSVAILKHDLTVCLSTYKTILTQLPNEITHSFSVWCKKINIQAVTEKLTNVLEDVYFTTDLTEEVSEKILALGMMTKVLEIPISESEIWTKLLLKNDNKIRQNIASILLSISEKCISKDDFEIILRENKDFVVKYLSVYFERCLTDVVMDSSVFVYVVKYFADNYRNYEEKYENLVELLNKVWPNLKDASFELKLSVASDFLRLPRNVGLIPPVEWVMNVITGDDVTLDHRIRLITMLPGGEEYRSCYRHMAGMLPIRLSEMRGDHAAILRALLDSLATSGDLTLLEIIVTLAAADDTKGWWDEAIDACMASLADRRDETIYDAAYQGMKRRAGLGGCQRVFLPLLRHSTRAFCEEYTSKIITDVISTLKTGFKEPSNTEIYRERVLSYAKSFSILQVVIDKIPAKNLETGVINVRAGSQDPWHVIKEVCVCSVTLRNKVRCPDNASEAIQDACLRLQCSAYNCLVSALCKRSPSQKQYGAVFDVSVFSKIVDDVQYDFWPRGYRVDYKTRKQLDSGEGGGARTMGTSLTFTGTVRTKLYMATLSENPLQYDMIPNEDEEEEEEEEDEDSPVSNSNHPLNARGCLVSITTLLVHVSSLEQCGWIASLADQLSSINIVNAKWTIAQAICNAETELKPHASVLIPALLDLVAATPKVAGDKKLLNNLHIDILWTIIKWNLPELTSYKSMSTCVEYLISTCIEHRSQSGVYQRLTNTLNTLLQMYGASMEIDWSGLQKHLDDLPTSSSYLMPILLRILKNKIQIPGLLPIILNTFDSKGWMSTSKLPEVFGLALSLEKHQKTSLEKFWQILGNVKNLSVNSYVKILMYAQRAERRCCNAQNFRIITDLASKVEKSKCLSIISMYLEHLEEDSSSSEVFETIGVKELLEGDSMVEAMKVVQGGLKFMSPLMRADIVTVVANNCRSSSSTTRKQAYAVMLTVFQDLVQTKDTLEHPAKRQATQSTPILNTMTSHTVYHGVVMREVARGMFDGDEGTAKVMRDGVEECLSKDMGIRFAELFYIIFYLSRNDSSEMTDQGYVFLELLFRNLKQQDGFTDIKLSDEALPSDVSLNLSVSQKYIETYRQIDVQMSIANILDVLIDSAKTNSKICHEICIRIIKCIQNQNASPRFDLESVMAKLLTDILKEELNSATPLVIETSRVFLDSVKNGEDFKNSLEVLKKNVVNTEGISYYDVLFEDFVLREMGRNFFDSNIKEEINTDVEMKDFNQEFSIEGMKEVFGYLSNWDDLRLQDKSKIEELLPPLLTERENFQSNLETYFENNNNLDYKLWFNKMAGCFVSNKLGKSVCQFKEIWLNDIQKWPVREFVTSSVIEAVKWPEYSPKTFNIGPKDCLVEWAARLMIRSSYFDGDQKILITCRDDELKWSSEANRRGLSNLVLECVKRNKSLLLETEALKWFEESLVARRLIALKSHDSGMLRKILETTEREDSGVSVRIKKLILLLKKDLGVLSKDSLDDVILSVDSMDKEHLVSMDNRKVLKSVYELAMENYDELWDLDGTSKDELLSNMASVVEKMLDHNLSNEHNLLICILLSRLANFDGVLDEETAKKILDLITLLLETLDSFSIGYINSIKQVFPPDLWSQYKVDRSESLGQCTEYLQLICDPTYTLFQYCAELAKDLNNWKTIYDRIKQKYGSTYGGTDYRSLNTIKKKLFDIENSNIESRHKLLKPISTDLEKKLKAIKLAPGVDRVLRLSQLSPSLGKADILEGQRENLRKLLGLPATVYVVKFVEQVKVFMDSIRRPCEVTVLLSDGSTKRYMIKSGEPLSNDASVQRNIAALSRYSELQVPGYNVTTLSDDCAILEFLEDHDRLRDLMGDKVKIPVTRLDNDKLVQSPTLAMEQHVALCSKIPVYTLRSSIEERCASMEEFIMKKQTFMDTLSTMTITNWLFGIGDRHLQNIMFNKKTGGICAIDWASIFQYGLREFVPARLTSNILAVCNVKVLESRLQNMLVCLRRSQKLYESFIRISFYWKGRDFEEMSYIKDILEGNRVSYEITRDVIDKSNIKCKEEYIKTLDTVFEGFTHKQTYSIEEQVSCLLQHCTDPKILSIIPRGWESWI